MTCIDGEGCDSGNGPNSILPPLTDCATLGVAMAAGGCAAACNDVYSDALKAAALDRACPAAVAVVAASIPVTLTAEQLTVLQDTSSPQFQDFANDFSSGIADTMEGVLQDQVEVLRVGSRRRLADRQLQTAANIDFEVSFPAADPAAAAAAAASVDVSAALEAAEPISVSVGGVAVEVAPAAAAVEPVTTTAVDNTAARATASAAMPAATPVAAAATPAAPAPAPSAASSTLASAFFAAASAMAICL